MIELIQTILSTLRNIAISKRDGEQINAVKMEFLRRGCTVKLEHQKNNETKNKIKKEWTTICEIGKIYCSRNAHRCPSHLLKWNPP